MSWQHPETTTVRIPKRKGGEESAISLRLRRTVTNLPIRVPSTDWAAIITGSKQMFRAYNRRVADEFRPVVPPEMEVPRPCLLYAARHDTPDKSRRWEAVPGILLSHRQEPLGSITPEDVAAEGFNYLPAFRLYWKRRYPTIGWKPWDKVSVLQVRPMDELDMKDYAHVLFHELFGEWLPA